LYSWEAREERHCSEINMAAHITRASLLFLFVTLCASCVLAEDLCPDDPLKTVPGNCGCGVPEADVCDLCPSNDAKTVPGVCGCAVADVDTDGDGFLDCKDDCPMDFRKTSPGVCGCGILDADTDHDGVLDCLDNCPHDEDKTEPGVCGCNQIEQTPCDKCPDDPKKVSPGVCGCGVPEFDIHDTGDVECPTNRRPGRVVNFNMGVLYQEHSYAQGN